jgi:hypothetical protein
MSNDQREDLLAAGMLPKLTEKASATPVVLPSRHKIGDKVKIEGTITSICFDEKKVLYAVKVDDGLYMEVPSEHVQPKGEA